MPAIAESPPVAFGVISQRSPTLTAQYWNPILRFVSEKSGISLSLKLNRSGPDHAAMINRGELDFIYSNHQFTAENSRIGYRVIARPARDAITGQLVVLDRSPVRSIAQLDGKEVVFPSRAAFVGYYVPMDALLRQKITVNALFAGNQEGAIGQLKAGRAAAAGVNSEVVFDFAQREGFVFRVLWESESYQGIPIAVHPRITKHHADSVRDALVRMTDDPEGARILKASAQLIKQPPPLGFVRSNDTDYENVRKFHRSTLVKSD